MLKARLKRVPQLFEQLRDRGYISKKLFEDLFGRGIQLVTKLKRKMSNILMPLEDKLLLRRRGIIESVINILKNTFHLEHTRHRSVRGFFANIFACIIAYAYHENKPSVTPPDRLITQ